MTFSLDYLSKGFVLWGQGVEVKNKTKLLHHQKMSERFPSKSYNGAYSRYNTTHDNIVELYLNRGRLLWVNNRVSRRPIVRSSEPTPGTNPRVFRIWIDSRSDPKIDFRHVFLVEGSSNNRLKSRKSQRMTREIEVRSLSHDWGVGVLESWRRDGSWSLSRRKVTRTLM